MYASAKTSMLCKGCATFKCTDKLSLCGIYVRRVENHKRMFQSALCSRDHETALHKVDGHAHRVLLTILAGTAVYIQKEYTSHIDSITLTRESGH